MSEEQKYTATPGDQALFTHLITGRVVLTIQEAYAAGKFDQETYKHLYEIARQADRAAHKLGEMLEQPPVTSLDVWDRRDIGNHSFSMDANGILTDIYGKGIDAVVTRFDRDEVEELERMIERYRRKRPWEKKEYE